MQSGIIFFEREIKLMARPVASQNDNSDDTMENVVLCPVTSSMEQERVVCVCLGVRLNTHIQNKRLRLKNKVHGLQRNILKSNSHPDEGN